jgi:hypothetical protein
MTAESLMLAFTTLARIEKGFRQLRFMPLTEPWWHSITCTCERCLDFDALICEHKAQPGDRPLFAQAS